MDVIKGKVWKFGDNINTDVIIPGRYMNTPLEEMKTHALEMVNPRFPLEVKKGDVIVGGDNFGCGSSREQAVYAIKENNVVCVIAQSYPDIFYRNSLSNGLVLISLSDPSVIHEGDTLQVNLDAGTITNLSQNSECTFEMNPDDKSIFKQGGMIGRVRQHLEEILQAA